MTLAIKRHLILVMFIHYLTLHNKKLSCRRETTPCFLSLNILLSHSRLLKIIRNDTAE